MIFHTRKQNKKKKIKKASASLQFFFFLSLYFLNMVTAINEYTLENNTVFSIAGKGLKLNTAEDVKEFVETIDQMDDLEVIKLSGNTIGVEAGQALAEALKTKTKLKVCY